MPSHEASIPETDPQKIKKMFDRMASAYDRFNRFSSLGLDDLWRKKTVEDIRPGMRVLDMGTGTGDLAFEAARRLEGHGQVLALDFSEPMIEIARRKSAERGMDGLIEWHIGRIEDLPLATGPFDAVVSGFVLRNLIENIHPILKHLRLLLKPGGFLSFTDLTEPERLLPRILGNVYLQTAVRFWSILFFKESYPVGYLDRSMRRFFRASGFAKLLAEMDFHHVKTDSFLGGAITLYRAFK